jgi:lysophospholipase L1-like esterase
LDVIPNTDMMIVESPHVNGWQIFDNISERLVFNNGRYTLDITNPYDNFSPSNSYKEAYPGAPRTYEYQKGYGYSSNGKYIAFAARDASWGTYPYRYFLYDVSTKSSKIFSVGKYDPRNEPYYHISKDFGVSNDGKYIAGGSHPMFNIWNTDSCAVNFTGVIDSSAADDPCVPREIGYKKTSGGGYNYYLTEYDLSSAYYDSVRNFKFSEDNKTITFEHIGQTAHHFKTVTIYAPGYTPPRLNYLALGDSYSSGEGDTYVDPRTNKKRYRAHTDVEGTTLAPREKCHVSMQSYPYKIANSFSWDIASQSNIAGKWQTVACSGAQKYDANEQNSAGYLGQGKGSAKQVVTNGSIPRLQGYTNAAQLKVDALNEFIPGRQKQVEFVKKYKPKVITLTMGGNDVGFGGIIGDCILFTTSCSKATESGRKELGSQLKKQFTELVEFYEELKIASPGVKIYVLGYPQAIVDDENASCPASLSTINHDERKLFVAGYWYMNQVIQTAARAKEIQYVDTQWSLSGHRLCEAGGNAYATGLAMYGSSEAQETFHPNADGHSLIVNKFYEELDYENPLTYSGYADDADSNLTEADIPDSIYLQTSTSPTRNVEHKASTDPEQTRLSAMNIVLDKLSFLAGSTVQMTLHSDPVNLGIATATVDGSMSAAPVIPSTVPPGYHTLTLSGQTPSGEAIEYEQIILVKGEDSDDIDDNGIPDDQQVCGPFIMPANEDEDYDGIDDACDPEVTDPILYVARNGDTAKGEDAAKLYIYRNTRASSLTGITTDYVDTSTDPNNKEALVAASLDPLTTATYNRFIMLEDANNSNIKIPTILARDTTNTCIALQPVDYLSPALNPTDLNYVPRGFTKLTALPGGESCG